MNPYKILNSKPSDTIDKIKKRYKKLCIKHHPDTGGDPERFHEIQKAWELVNNPDKITFHDIFGDSIEPDEIDFVLNRLEMNFNSCLSSSDPIKTMSKISGVAIEKLQDKITQKKYKISDLNEKKSKIKTDLKNNIFANFIDKMTSALDEEISSMDKEIKIIKKCQIVIDYFEWIGNPERIFFNHMIGANEAKNPIFFSTGS